VSDAVVTARSEPGVFARAVGVILSPAATFASVARDPRPAGVLFLACVLVGLAGGFPQLTERGRQATLDAQMQSVERFTGQPATPEMRAQLERQVQFGVYGAFVGVFIMMPAVSILIAAVLWVTFNAGLGGSAPFKAILAIVTHSQVVAALGAVVSAPIQLAQGVQSLAGPFNLGGLVPMLDPSSFIATFLSGISVFALWQIVVCAIGLAVLYRRRATGIALGLIAVYLVLAATITNLFSSFSGGAH
jgi:hypothetical protein